MVPGRAILRLPVMLVIALGTASAQEQRCEPDKVAQKYPVYAGKVVKIGVSPNQPPYSFADPSNPERLIGVEAEMIEDAMNCAGLKYEYVKGAWSGVLAALMSGSADVMIGNVNYRPDRAERANFILYMRAGQSVVVQRGNPKKITDVASLCGATGSATLGSSSALQIERQSKICVENGKPAINFLPAADGNAAYRQLANARIDFEVDDAASAAARALKEPEYEVSYTVVTDFLSGFVVTKSNTAMLQIVADGMKVQERAGNVRKLAIKYGLPTELLIPVEARQ